MSVPSPSIKMSSCSRSTECPTVKITNISPNHYHYNYHYQYISPNHHHYNYHYQYISSTITISYYIYILHPDQPRELKSIAVLLFVDILVEFDKSKANPNNNLMISQTGLSADNNLFPDKKKTAT